MIERSPNRRTRLIGLSLVFFVVAALAAAAGWAGGVVLRRPQVASAHPIYAFATAKQGEVGASININASASWDLRSSGVNRAVGILTTKDLRAGSKLSVGDVLYSVNLRKTVIAKGDIPAFRAIKLKDEGADVRQLQRFLIQLGFLHNADGAVGESTVRAIKRWQTSIGEQSDGIVQQGDILFVPKIPTDGAIIDPKLEVGSSLEGGEKILSILPRSPSFSLKVTEEQASLITENSSVSITGPNGEIWQALASRQSSGSAGVSIDLRPTQKNRIICQSKCHTLSLAKISLLSAQAVTTKQTSGIIIPSAALTVNADNKTIVYDGAGRPLLVQVAASANGDSVVKGISPGTRVRIPGSLT